MFECNNILSNWKESKTINYKQFEKLIGTYLHMYNVTGLEPVYIPLSEKKCENFEEFTQPKHTFLCPTYLVLRNLLNLTNRRPLHRLPLRCVLPLPSSSSWPSCHLFPVLLTSPASLTSISLLHCWCSLRPPSFFHLLATCP